MSRETPARSRALRLGVGGMILLVAIVGVGLRIFRSALPLTPAEAVRVARAEMVRRDPEFARMALLHHVSPYEVNVGRLWNWAYRWEVLLQRAHADTGYVVEINGRDDVRVSLAFDITKDSWTCELPLR